MDRQALLLQLAQRVSAACAADDWPALADVNGVMAASLPAMAALGPWSVGEHAALSTLRQVHGLACARCVLASDTLGERLSALRDNKEGWLAYALDNDVDADGDLA